MVNDYEAFFSCDFMGKLEDIFITRMCTSFVQDDEQKKTVSKLFRAFTKRGVPARVVLGAFAEAFASEGGPKNG